MDCRTSSEIMIKWMDGPLAEPEEKQLMAHIEHCSTCRLEYAEWQELASALSELPDPVPSSGFEARVMAAIDPALYAAPQRIIAKPQTGRLLVWMGILGMISLMLVETAAWLQHLAVGWLHETATYQVMTFIYERFILRGVLLFILPQKGVFEWLVRFDASSHWWYMLGTFNLVMLLILITVSLDRILLGRRGEVR
ncbi:MAG: zf-HC2 domain-containing protein [Bacillota bacterium]|nr:zf-HC2 domain-containing protein [Bacillota bacterium]MDW7676665.1 zf-HC2 domain-containing protein [Bacillota bacterium]